MVDSEFLTPFRRRRHATVRSEVRARAKLRSFCLSLCLPLSPCLSLSRIPSASVDLCVGMSLTGALCLSCLTARALQPVVLGRHWRDQ